MTACVRTPAAGGGREQNVAEFQTTVAGLLTLRDWAGRARSHASRDEPAAVAGALDELCGREDVRPQDIVVLSAHGRDHSAIYGDDSGRWQYTDKRGRKGSKGFFSSIPGFKGLESPVVVLCELGDLDDESRDNQLYVGMSRARNHCVIVAPR
ncbi:MAG: ATP-binding domain-containing protein [Solirubrobacteraceae bacterium]